MISYQKSKAWYLLQFKPNSYRIAELNLKRQGFETFIPLQEITKRKFSRFVNCVIPLFPGYMFVSFDLNESLWTKIRSTSGVLRLVSIGGIPKVLPSDIIDGIVQRCDKFGRIKPSKVPAKGDDVRIIRGSFADFLAKIEKIDDNERALVLLKFAENMTRVEVETNQLEIL